MNAHAVTLIVERRSWLPRPEWLGEGGSAVPGV